MSLRREGYQPRIIDAKISEYLNIFGAISIEGPKWCGKTWTALNHAKSVNYIMDPAGSYSNRERALLNPALALEGAFPHLVDEWQEVPAIWDAVRFDVDREHKTGKYILTGSVTPPRSEYKHSGAGRFAIIRMRPMSLFESGNSVGAVSFSELFQEVGIEPFSADIDLQELIGLTVRGGWPETVDIPEQSAIRLPAAYMDMISKNELFRRGERRRDTAKLKKLLRSIARNNATTVSLSTLANDSDSQHKDSDAAVSISRQTTAEYMDDLRKIFIIEDIQGWSPEIRSKSRIRMAPKIMYADPSLAIAVLGLTGIKLAQDLKTYGQMFENLCLRDISIYAGNAEGTVYHYRDNSDLEVDAVVEMADGTWGAFEIKLGEHQVDNAASTLKRMRDKVVNAGAKKPACLCVITGGGYGRQRDDGVYVIPINALRP